jgi:hypothetical protein
LDTKGVNLAADHIAEQFRAIGLKTDLYEGTPFQKFTVTTSSKLGPAEKNTLALVPFQKPSPLGRGQGEGAGISQGTLTPTLSLRERE